MAAKLSPSPLTLATIIHQITGPSLKTMPAEVHNAIIMGGIDGRDQRSCGNST